MKRFVLASAAAALVLGAAGAAAAQPSYNHDHRVDSSQQREGRHDRTDTRSNDRHGSYDNRGSYNNRSNDYRGSYGGYDRNSGYQYRGGYNNSYGGYAGHNEWRSGYRMPAYDWNRGHRIDYRAYRLNAPPYGYEWREVDGQYVLAAIATGLIASIIAGGY